VRDGLADHFIVDPILVDQVLVNHSEERGFRKPNITDAAATSQRIEERGLQLLEKS
jgi:triosephosphate isomerase